jgi:hypothetical protein
MSNTTFDAKEAVKYMLDGLQVENIADGSIYRFNNEFLIRKTSNFGTNELKIKDFIEGKYEQKTTDTFSCLYKIRITNLVKWHRPLVVWYSLSLLPEKFKYNNRERVWFREKKNFFDLFDEGEVKVLKWKADYFPESFEVCE